MTTITVDDSVRRRLKRLAALLDMSQGEIVKISLDLFEKLILPGEVKIALPRKIAKMLDEISEQVRKEDPEWARRSKIIEKAPTPPEEAIWALEI